METTNLKWDEERQGYVCDCGAFYERPKGWIPRFIGVWNVSVAGKTGRRIENVD